MFTLENIFAFFIKIYKILTGKSLNKIKEIFHYISLKNVKLSKVLLKWVMCFFKIVKIS